MMRLFVIALATLVATGCIYPRRGTSLSEVQGDGRGQLAAPDDIWQLTIVGAEIPLRKRGDLSWDDDGGAPDAFVRIYRDEALIFETEVIDDAHAPRWDVTLPRNVRMPAGAALRVELWDRDTIGADPVGRFETRGLPANAVPGADARLHLEGGGSVTLRVSAPRPHRGVGIEEYELRPDALLVLRVAAYSPASRANVEAGDAIVAIGERTISDMTQAEAASALSMAAQRQTQLIVRGANGTERAVDLDRHFVWQTM